MTAQPTPQLRTKKQAVQMIQFSLRNLDTQLARGTIGCVRIGGRVFFRDVDIETFIARHAVPARATSGAI